ncbi:MAG: VOC family protein [Pyrinomonadaceae bacterium]
MAKIIGIGGVFFKSPNPASLYEWYGQWLGMDISNQPGVSFSRDMMPAGSFAVFSAFDESTDYFDPAGKPFMFNLIVDDLTAAIEQVREGGAEIVGEIERYDYGNFGWFIDPDGNKVELWEPAANQ